MSPSAINATKPKISAGVIAGPHFLLVNAKAASPHRGKVNPKPLAGIAARAARAGAAIVAWENSPSRGGLGLEAADCSGPRSNAGRPPPRQALLQFKRAKCPNL